MNRLLTFIAERMSAIIRPDIIRNEIVRLVKYQMVGFSNSLVSLLVLNVFFLLWPPSTQIILLAGSTVAYVAGDLNSFWWNGKWTFKAGKLKWQQFARFAVLCISGLAVNATVLWSSSGWLLGLLLPAWLVGNIAFISMALTGTLGYLVCRLWVFPSLYKSGDVRRQRQEAAVCEDPTGSCSGKASKMSTRRTMASAGITPLLPAARPVRVPIRGV